MTNIITIVTSTGPNSSTCGYCGPPGGRSETDSSHTSAGLVASQLSCEIYQKMIDRGWRRSGTYCYKPDLRRSCCPNYTIKLGALDFKPSKSQRKLVNRWNRFILDGEADERDHMQGGKSHGKGKKTSSMFPIFSLSDSIHASEHDFAVEKEPAHKFEVTLEPSRFTDEKFALYSKYQTDIHHDTRNSPSGFKRFLVDSPLASEPIPYLTPPPKHLPSTYGSYHQMYRLDGKLTAVAVLDILPNCVSSVYFMYDTTFEKNSLGKLSALREISLAKEMRECGAPGMEALYMGFYIHSCPKMRYKGEYHPSYLLDPETYTWHPLKSCIPALEKYRFAAFSFPEDSLEGADDPGPVPTYSLPDEMLMEVNVVDKFKNGVVTVIPVTTSAHWRRPRFRESVYSLVDSLGIELSKEVILYS